MPELLALTRLSLVRSRPLLLMMVGAVVIAAATAYVAGPIDQDSIGQQIALFTLFLTLMPAALSSVVLFDYSAEGNMNLPESGCSHWILRMPVKSSSVFTRNERIGHNQPSSIASSMSYWYATSLNTSPRHCRSPRSGVAVTPRT